MPILVDLETFQRNGMPIADILAHFMTDNLLPSDSNDNFQLAQNLLYHAGQTEDCKNAYEAVSKQFLKDFTISTLTAESIIDLILLIHKHIAKTLNQQHFIAPGKFRKGERVYWKHGDSFAAFIRSYLDESVTSNALHAYANQYNIDPSKLEALLNILTLFKESMLKLTSKLEKERLMNKNIPAMGAHILPLLGKHLVSGTFPEDKKNILLEFLTVGVPANTIDQEIHAAATTIVSAWLHSQAANLNNIASLIATVFNQFYRILPFDRGTGRIAFCLVNTILTTFNKPELIISAEQQLNPYSQYAIAKIEMMKNPYKFENFLTLRIVVGKIKTPPSLTHVLNQKTALAHTLQRIQTEFPRYAIYNTFNSHCFFHEHQVNHLLRQLQQRKITVVEQEKLSSEYKLSHTVLRDDSASLAIHCKVLSVLIQEMQQIYTLLNDAEAKETTQSILTIPYSATEIANIKQKLNTLTHKTQWQPFQKNNQTTFRIELSNETEARDLKNALAQTTACELDLTIKKLNQKFIIKATQVRYNKLMETESLIDIKDTPKQNPASMTKSPR